METSFTLQCRKQQNPFHGHSRTRLDKMFKFTHHRLADVVNWLLGEMFYQLETHHRTNMDIYSTIMAWALQLAKVETLLGL